MDALNVEPNISIPLEEFEFSFARSGGPGGQNVNKVNSKAILRWQIEKSSSVPAPVRQRFLNRFGNRLTTEGELVIASQKYRDQAKNVEDCLEKLRGMVAMVAVPPKPRRATKPTLASKTKRLDSKRAHSQKKQQRGRESDY